MNLLSQFADDTNIYLKGNSTNIDNVMQTLTKAEQNLDLKVNYEKSTLYRIGSLTDTDAELYTQKQYAWNDPPIHILGTYVHQNFEIMSQKNLEPLLNKIDIILSSWSKHKLTLTGRVLVVNLLIESLFVYCFSVLAILDETITKEIKGKIWHFIWVGKQAKMSYDLLRRPKKDGGLWLVDLHAKHQSLLCQWVFLTNTDDYLKVAMNESVLPELANDKWYVNLDTSDITHQIPDTFWKYVIIAWCKYTSIEPISKQEVCKQLMSYNSHIKIQCKVIFYAKAYQQGCKYILDILNAEQTRLLRYDEFEVKYPNSVTWLEYSSLISAIPYRWKRIIIDNIMEKATYVHTYDRMKTIKGSVTRYIYNEIVSNALAPADSYNKWCKVIPNFVSLEEFCSCFMYRFKCTNSTKLRDFQFQLLHKRLPSNKELYYWKIKDTKMCDFCNNEDSILHTIYECETVQYMWQLWEEYIEHKYQVQVKVDTVSIVTNLFIGKPKSAINTLGLIMKQLIYRCKCLGERISFGRYINEVQLIKSIELHNARKSNQVGTHQHKWDDKSSTNVMLNTYIAQYINNM